LETTMAQSHRKTSAPTGNRRGIELPARMAGGNLCSGKRRVKSTDARESIVVTRSRGHGWPLLFLLVLAGVVGGSSARGGQFMPAASKSIPLHNLRDATPDEIAAAEGMEAIMTDLLLQEMRKSVQESQLVPTSQGERIFRQMLDNEYSRTMSSQGMLGIKDLVLAQIRRKR